MLMRDVRCAMTDVSLAMPHDHESHDAWRDDPCSNPSMTHIVLPVCCVDTRLSGSGDAGMPHARRAVPLALPRVRAAARHFRSAQCYSLLLVKNVSSAYTEAPLQRS